MNVYVCSVSDRRVPIALREQLSFTRSRVSELDRQFTRTPGILGCVLLSTCNRTELYFSCEEGYIPDGPGLLCRAAGVERPLFDQLFHCACGEEAVRHLLEVAAGLRSRIWGEDQILTQVREALSLARAAQAADAVLETLFRIAISAGKEVKSKLRFTEVSTSSAGRAVEVLAEECGTLRGKSALVIGNGEMGRLSAQLLREQGCAVTVTLRTYRHGETVVPAGCGVVPYEMRYEAMEGMDILLSATTSPHYTVISDEFAHVRKLPRCLVDLAIPRDIDPSIEQRKGIKLYNIDTLGISVERTFPEEGEHILADAMERFRQWAGYRASIPAIEELRAAVLSRVLTSDLTGMTPEECAELAASRAVDLLTENLKGCFSAEDLTYCTGKIRVHTRA